MFAPINQEIKLEKLDSRALKDIENRLAELASQIKHIRRENPASVRELAKLTGVSTRTIWRLESGRPINLISLLKILCVFKCDIQVVELDQDEC